MVKRLLCKWFGLVPAYVQTERDRYKDIYMLMSSSLDDATSKLAKLEKAVSALFAAEEEE